ncbi:MAG: hypothetical protein K6E40_12200 [Desulfovibrio sp.]|nr:hypothetical protein [Desulfovibrio sp.]
MAGPFLTLAGTPKTSTISPASGLPRRPCYAATPQAQTIFRFKLTRLFKRPCYAFKLAFHSNFNAPDAVI